MTARRNWRPVRFLAPSVGPIDDCDVGLDTGVKLAVGPGDGGGVNMSRRGLVKERRPNECGCSKRVELTISAVLRALLAL